MTQMPYDANKHKEKPNICVGSTVEISNTPSGISAPESCAGDN